MEERALADSDDSDRFATCEREFAGTQRDTLTSLINTSGALVKMTAERDAARAEVTRLTALVALLEAQGWKALVKKS